MMTPPALTVDLNSVMARLSLFHAPYFWPTSSLLLPQWMDSQASMSVFAQKYREIVL